MTVSPKAESPTAQTNSENLPEVKLADNNMAINTNASFDLLMDPSKFDHLQRVAKVYASSTLVPKQYQDNIGDCIIGLQMAMRLGVDPFMFLQNTYVIQGKPGMEAKLAIALINNRGPFAGPVQYKFDRDKSGQIESCTAYARHKNGEVCESTITRQMVDDEDWSKKPGSKWKTMPEQMYCYRAATFLGRIYCPEVLMGMETTDELDDVYGGTKYVESQSSQPAESKAQSIVNRLKKQPESKDQVIDHQPADDTAADPEAVSQREQQLIVAAETMAHEQDCTDLQAQLAIAKYSRKLFDSEPVDLDDKRFKSLLNQAKSGGITVNKDVPASN